MTLLYFALMIGGLIFFHELGHYTFARISGVHVVTFSVGFGPTLVKWTRKGTEYRVAVIPLGGYVKLLGDDPHEEISPELEGSAFLHKSLWHRFWIILGGPLFNLILPFIIFFGIGLATTHHAPSLVGAVSPDSPAAYAGLQRGDRISEIDGSSVHYWWELQEMISARPGMEVPIAYERAGGRVETTIKPASVRRTIARELGISNKVGRIGINPTFPLPILAVQRDSQAARSGFQSGDCIRAIGGEKILRWEEIQPGLARRKGTDFQVVVERNEKDAFRCTPPNAGEAKNLVTLTIVANTVSFGGMESGEFVIQNVEDSSSYLTDLQNPPPAKRWGLLPGDKILSVDGRRCSVSGGVVDYNAAPVAGFGSWGEMRNYMHEHVSELFTVVFRRTGEFGSVSYIKLEEVALVVGSEQTEINTRMEVVVFGAKPYSRHQRGAPDLIPNAHRLSYGIHLMATQSVEAIHLTIAGIIGLFRGDISFKEMGGPIMVANLAGASRKHGWAAFFRIMAILSVSLGLLNLLPIPVLDGGHLLFILIEAVQRKPISMRVRQTATFVGLAFILLLMIMVFKNDIERNWGSIVGFFGG